MREWLVVRLHRDSVVLEGCRLGRRGELLELREPHVTVGTRLPFPPLEHLTANGHATSDTGGAYAIERAMPFGTAGSAEGSRGESKERVR